MSDRTAGDRLPDGERPSATGGWRAWRPGFRLRVFGLLAAVLTGALVTGLILQRAVLRQRLDRQIERNHEQEHTELEVLARGRNPETGRLFAGDVEAIFETFLRRNLPAEGEVYLTFIDGKPFRPSGGPFPVDRDPALATRWASLRTGERGWADTPAGPARWLAAPVTDVEGETAGVFVVATFVEDARREIDESLRIEAVVSAGVLLAALAIAYSLAGRLLRPVRDVTDNARTLSESDLSARIPESGNDEIAELARTYNAMLDRLRLAFETQRRFVDDAGHELRTPITIVRGHLELMGDDPDERQATVALVTDELDRMSRIVTDLLVLARSDQPNFLAPAPVDIAELTTGLWDRAALLGPRRWTIEATASVTVLADEQRLAQAVLNLARNAVEHTATDGRIGLGSAVADGDLHLWVRDDGPGVAEADRDRIFARFSRGDSGRRRSEGAGLGLAIVGAIAEAHGGRVRLACPPAGGSVFTISIPARVVAPVAPPPGPFHSADATPTYAVTIPTPDPSAPHAGADDPTLPFTRFERTPWPGS